MSYYEIFVADSKYHGDSPLTYSYDGELATGSVVSVPLRGRTVSGFVGGKVKEPDFTTREIKAVFSQTPLPPHLLKLAEWLKDYYATSFGQALRQLAPAKPVVKVVDRSEQVAELPVEDLQVGMELPLTDEQKLAIKFIQNSKTSTVLLHGETGSGKTRVYLELAKESLKNGKSVIILTPEIALTGQLEQVIKQQLHAPVYVLHSQLTDARRKKIWKAILESDEPMVVLGPRSALFSPVKNLGLVVVDEAHEPAYKQEQAPRYHANRVASQLGSLTGTKVVLGTATPTLIDYYLARQRGAIARMGKQALGQKHAKAEVKIIDIKDRNNFTKSPFLSKQLIEAITSALSVKKQVIIYLNRRGSARLILCNKCGWQLLCPNCDIPLIFHADEYLVRCHSCGHSETPPTACPVCKNTDIIYKSIGTKALAEMVQKLFSMAKVGRFDTDSSKGERLNELYNQIHSGKIDILVGTQILAKGLDLPRLGLVGVVTAEAALTIPDFSSEERTFSLLYQIIGRVGRGHGKGEVILQSYNPDSELIKVAAARDYKNFYNQAVKHRQLFRFPPFAYLLRLSTKRISSKAAETAAQKLKSDLLRLKLPVEIIGPTPNFYARRGQYFYWQLVVKTKNRSHLLEIARLVPAGWTIDLDPINLL